MQSWLMQALQNQWPEWSHEETIKVKLLFLDYLGKAFAARGDEDGRRLAEHLEGLGGEGQATLFAGGEMVPGPAAAFGNAPLTPDAPLLFPAVLAAIEQQNKGGKELLAALITGLEGRYRMGDHAEADLVGALLGVANAFELDGEEGWPLLLSSVRNYGLPREQTFIARGVMAQNIVLAGSLAREEWSAKVVSRTQMSDEWMQALQRTSDKPGMNHFLMAAEINADQIVDLFRRRAAAGHVPEPHIEYYIDAVMTLEDICCIPLFFRR